MPKPSYTIDTLTYLVEKYPDHDFHLIMGGNEYHPFSLQKNNRQIQEKYHRLVYPRPKIEIEDIKDQVNTTLMDAPMIEISSSFIRKSIKEGKDVRYFLPEKTYNYLVEMHFYEK